MVSTAAIVTSAGFPISVVIAAVVEVLSGVS